MRTRVLKLSNTLRHARERDQRGALQRADRKEASMQAPNRAISCSNHCFRARFRCQRVTQLARAERRVTPPGRAHQATRHRDMRKDWRLKFRARIATLSAYLPLGI